MELFAQTIIDVLTWFLIPFAGILAVSWVISLFRYKQMDSVTDYCTTYNPYILPATLVVLALFWVIFKMYINKRG